MFMSEDDREEIKLRDRKGFVRIAGGGQLPYILSND
jgi:hypothetical protein